MARSKYLGRLDGPRHLRNGPGIDVGLCGSRDGTYVTRPDHASCAACTVRYQARRTPPRKESATWKT